MIGQMIKEARNAAKLTQEQLAWAVGGLTAADIRKAEHEDIFLSNDELKRIAKATNVTQKSLLDAAKADKAAAEMAAQPPVPPMPAGNPGMVPPPPMGEPPMELSSTERKLIEQFRAADSATKKAVKKLVKGDQPELVDIVNNGMPMPGPMGGPGGRPRF